MNGVLLLAFGALLLGFGLIVLELIVPSLGVLSVTSGVLIIGAIVAAFGESTAWGFTYLGLAVIGVPGMLKLGATILPKTALGRRFILSGPVTPVSGGAVNAGRLAALQGRHGVAQSDLRPSGAALFDGERMDVVAETDWIDAGTPIEVVRVDGFRVIVRPGLSAAAGASNPQENQNA